MIASIILALLASTTVQSIVYWAFNIVFPTFNAQAIITSILAKESEFCQIFGKLNDTFKKIGDDQIYLNWIILFVHAVLYLMLLIAIDCGLIRIRSRGATNSTFDEKKLDSDVLDERRRILNSDPVYVDQTVVNRDGSYERQHTDHLIVRDLVKSFPNKQKPAVDHLTFGAKRGEAFGLLGYNVS